MFSKNLDTVKKAGAALFCVAVLSGAGITAPGAAAQEMFIYNGAKLRFGAFGGLNLNFLGAGYQQLRAVPGEDFRIFKLSDGTGLGPYIGLIGEYNSGDILGVQVRLSYDYRGGELNDTAGGENNIFGANISYFNVEPGVRVNLGNPDLHVALGPSIGFTLQHDYDYEPGDNTPSVQGQEIDKWNNVAIGVWGGLAYDINLSEPSSTSQWYLTPFLEGSWVFDQRKSDIPDLQDNIDDVWSTVTARAGVQIKWGSSPGSPAPPPAIEVTPEAPSMDVSLRAPAGIREVPTVEEFFPLLNYVFFDDGSTALPSEYATLSGTEAASFREGMLFEDPGPGTDRESTRWQRQMSVYYNSLNIFADRLRNNSNTTITLLGSAPNEADGLAQAEAVKSYMVSTFNIAPDRIKTRGATRPQNASGTRSTPREDLPFIAEENRRVEILTDNTEILRPVSIRTAQGSPIENDLVLDVRAGASVTDWKVEVMGNGQTRTYGPYRGMTQRIDAAQILGTQEEGTYTARVTAMTSDGSTVVKDVPFTLVRRANSPMNDKRYSILFEYDESKTVQTYEKFLRETVAPQVENGSTVFIYGYTDKVGESEYNSKLSLKRTTAAQQILADAVGSMGRNVTFYTYGFGEGEYLAPFPNESPEGRYYNRTVIVEIVPGSQATSNK